MTETSTATDAKAGGRYHKRISVAASPATVFALMTEPDRLRRWQSIVSSVDLEVGGEYRHVLVPGAIASGRYTEIEADRRLVYSWEWANEPGDPAGASRVTVELAADGDRTIIDFTHDGLPDEEAAASHADGWDHFLDRLGVAAETGDAGANPWAAGPDDLDMLGAGEASLAIMLNLLRSTSSGDLDLPTPCAEFTVAQMLEHMTGSLGMIGSTAGAEIPPAPDDADTEGQMAHVAGSALAAWRRRGTDGEVEFVGGMAPATVPVSVAIAELFVHGWDLAQALDQPFTPGENVVAVADAAVRGVLPEDRGDAFGPAEPEDGLDPVEALMAFTGRTV